MGAVCCTPSWNKHGTHDGAFEYGHKCGCGSPRFKLLRAPKSLRQDGAAWSAVCDVFWAMAKEAVGIVQENSKKSCSGDIVEYSSATAALNRDWIPQFNATIAAHGYFADAYSWMNIIYLPRGGLYGSHMIRVPKLVIRLRRMPVDAAEESVQPIGRTPTAAPGEWPPPLDSISPSSRHPANATVTVGRAGGIPRSSRASSPDHTGICVSIQGR